ncbi:MAG: biopolymer transporter ExbD [Verrucomicrobia bacterium]|nr:biopolymer transporter ExbD [Verrucomicrobiota bacterium]
MEMIPHEELKPSNGINYAPMIDFLFLMLALFATLAISRAALYDSEVSLAELKHDAKSSPIRAKKEIQQINISINAAGSFKWMTEFQEYPMGNAKEIQEELARQYQIGALAQDKAKTEVLLHIDRKAPWEPIAKAIFAVRELGFSVHPVYELFED